MSVINDNSLPPQILDISSYLQQIINQLVESYLPTQSPTLTQPMTESPLSTQPMTESPLITQSPSLTQPNKNSSQYKVSTILGIIFVIVSIVFLVIYMMK